MAFDEESDPEPRNEDPGSLALPIGMLMISLVFGALAVTLLVFGVWPGACLLAASAAAGSYAFRRFRLFDAARR